MECKTCMFARRLEAPGEVECVECRRYAPKPKFLVDDHKLNLIVVFPVLHESDWCGEYKLSEEIKALQAKERRQKIEERLTRRAMRAP